MREPGSFSIRDLRLKSGQLVRNAESGCLSLITKRGRPAILAIPFDNRLLKYGVDRAMALRLFERKQITLAKAARLAGMSVEDFIELLGEAGIVAVDYPAKDLRAEFDAAL